MYGFWTANYIFLPLYILFGDLEDMAKQHFELVFVPKTHGNVISRFEEKLRQQHELREEVSAILSKENIVPTKIFITKIEEGKGSSKSGHIFEGFAWKKYWGKVRGEKKGFLRDTFWKNDFYIYVLYGKKRDGIMFATETENGTEIRRIGSGIYQRILDTMRKEGPLPLHAITRTGTI